jgi:hypothetical protein
LYATPVHLDSWVHWDQTTYHPDGLLFEIGPGHFDSDEIAARFLDAQPRRKQLSKQLPREPWDKESEGQRERSNEGRCEEVVKKAIWKVVARRQC